MPIRRSLGAILLSPLGLLLGVVILAPAAILLADSFFQFYLLRPSGDPGLANYLAVFSRPIHRTVLISTLIIALPVTALSVVGGYALAYYAVFGPRRLRQPIFALVVSLLMAPYLVLIYAWRILLGETGSINSALMAAEVIETPLTFLIYSPVAVIIAETTLLMPLAALTFYSALSGLAPELAEASRDLGAGGSQTFRRITLPLTGKAVLATTTIVFFLAAGDYVTPVLVGGPGSQTIGRLIAARFTEEGDFGAGSALAYIVLVVFLLSYVLFRQLLRAGRLLPARTL